MDLVDLVDLGYADDVDSAAQLDQSQVVPVLDGDVFVARWQARSVGSVGGPLRSRRLSVEAVELAKLNDDPAPRLRVALLRIETIMGWSRLVASYRELAEHLDEADPLGAAPLAGLAEKHALFRTAHAALDLSTAGAEEEAMSEGRLRARVAAWEREQRFAPRFVAPELEAAHEELRKARTDATLWAARADAAPIRSRPISSAPPPGRPRSTRPSWSRS